MRGRLEGGISGIVTSAWLRDGRRRLHAAGRRLMGATPTLHYFHGAGDPWSHLAAQLLPALAAAYPLRIVPHLVPAPSQAAAPEPGRLLGWGLRDAAQLARAHGLSFPDDAVAPDAAAVVGAEAALAGIDDPLAFADRAREVGDALWTGRAVSGGGDRVAALAEGAAALAKAGHYLPGVFAFEGECYWGVDRLPHLEARLAEMRRGAAVVRQLEAGELRGDARGAEVHFFLSFRSPYTHLAAGRVRALADRWNARLVLRPVLPMVMRGLPVPLEKRMYIVRDTRREAERLGIGFGRICDPVGAGVERGLAVLHRAIALGRGPDFAESFLAGAFAEAVDATTDAGLLMLAARAGLTEADVRTALADEGWRAVAEANRAEMFDAGLWGVPSFRVGDRPAQWGQDRLWAVERDLSAIAGEAE
ncbi:DsbA family protein [Sandaracinobacter sp.]|uniref:DsbA family protein n=1 Tax=Sandaracinobacter sp. TaxID=2487581 RepID=UPI0035AF6F42